MGVGFLFLTGIAAAGAIALAVLVGRMDRRGLPDQRRARRGAGNALLGLREFVEPSVEYLLQAQNVEQKEEEDDDGLGGDPGEIRTGLAEALGRTPVDHEEVRRHPSAAVRAGMDWETLFEQAVEDELRERPFRAPSIPPARRVAPRV